MKKSVGFLGAATWMFVAAAAGCGGSNASTLSPDASGDDGSVGPATDGATDGASSDDGSSPVDAAGGTEAGVEGGGGDASCAGMAAMTCRECCRMANQGGYATLVKEELKCACQPTLCGALEAGAGDGGAVADASTFGTGACASTCDLKSTADAACLKCLADATGTMTTPGQCYSDVASKCSADPSCVSYVACVSGCK